MESVDTVASLASSLADDPRRLAGLVIASLVLVVALISLKKDDDARARRVENEPDDADDVGAEAEGKTPKSVDEPEGSSVVEGYSTERKGEGDGKLRNVFSVKQRPIVHGSGGKKSSSDRPFESSYYFAHNKHSTG